MNTLFFIRIYILSNILPVAYMFSMKYFREKKHVLMRQYELIFTFIIFIIIAN